MLYEESAKGGYEKAQYNIGVCYKEGIGVQKNKIKAKKWLQLALKNGYEGAREELKELR